jgi:hypothetical protein
VSAEVEVRNGITIAGRGAVLIGFVRSGTVRVGQRTPPLTFGDSAPRRLELIAVQRLASADAGGSAVGLVFARAPSLKELEQTLPAGAQLTLDDAPDPADETS